MDISWVCQKCGRKNDQIPVADMSAYRAMGGKYWPPQPRAKCYDCGEPRLRKE